MQWANKLFGMGLLDPELEKRMTEQQRKQLGSGALFDAGLAMMAASGPSPYPTSLGQVLAQGVGAGRQSYGQQAQGFQEQMRAKMQQEQAEQQRQAQIQALGQIDPTFAQFAAAMDPRASQELMLSIAKERAKPQKVETSSYSKAATDMGLQKGSPEHAAMVRQLATQSKAPVVNVNSGQYSPFDKALATSDVSDFKDWRAKAMAANETGEALQVLEQINGLQQGGKIGEAQAMIGQYFGSDAAANRQVFQAVSRELVLNQASKLTGVISDKDMALLEQTVPAFGNDPRANKIIIDILRKASERAIKNYDNAESYRAEKGNLTGYRPLFSGGAQPMNVDAGKIDWAKKTDDEIMRELGAQ